LHFGLPQLVKLLAHELYLVAAFPGNLFGLGKHIGQVGAGYQLADQDQDQGSRDFKKSQKQEDGVTHGSAFG
jgi:hypothetical protein